MKTKITLLMATMLLAISFTGNTQNSNIPPLELQKYFGGLPDNEMQMHQFLAAQDGGFMVTGTMWNSDNFSYDIFLMRIDESGNQVWVKTYGSDYEDKGISLDYAADGGYILAGAAIGNTGDVTGNHGGYDIWVVKTDADGNMEWQKSFGGTEDDEPTAIKTDAGGNYIISGYTYSNNGSVSGNHGLGDAWILKISSSGLSYWRKCFGGIYSDYANDIIIAPDGNFIFCGQGGIGNVSVNSWMVKISYFDGSVIWNKLYGESYGNTFFSLCQDYTTGNYIYATGDVTGSFSGDAGNHGGGDVLLVKIDAANGNLLANKYYGGSESDVGYHVTTTYDGGLLLICGTSSEDGDVSNNDIEFYGAGWVVKLNSSLGIDWEECINFFPSLYNEGIPYGYAGFERSDGGYNVGISTNNYYTYGYEGFTIAKLSPCFSPPTSEAIITTTAPACGGAVTMSVPGCYAASYQWVRGTTVIAGATSRTYTATKPGTYTCAVIKECGGYATNSPNSIKSKKQKATISPSGSVTKCAATAVTFTANTGKGLTYQWFSGVLPIPGATSDTYTTTQAGPYNVLVTNTKTQCGSFSKTTTVVNNCFQNLMQQDVLTANNNNTAALFQNIPNPVKHTTVINYNVPANCQAAYLIITDMVGKTIKQINITTKGKGSAAVDASIIAEGVYVYSLYIDGKFIDSKHMAIIK